MLKFDVTGAVKETKHAIINPDYISLVLHNLRKRFFSGLLSTHYDLSSCKYKKNKSTITRMSQQKYQFLKNRWNNVILNCCLIFIYLFYYHYYYHCYFISSGRRGHYKIFMPSPTNILCVFGFQQENYNYRKKILKK